MMQLMLSLGLRLAEVVNLRWDDIDFLSEVLMIREGKGMKDRTLFIKDNNWRGVDDKTALQKWKERQTQELGKLPEHVFTTMSKGSKGNQLSDRYVQAMVRRYSKRAGISKKISPHTLRHTFATRLYKHTKDIAVVQKALGHSDLSTTMVYVHLVSSDVEQALSGIPEH
jgi:site-specific recombinase XerD